MALMAQDVADARPS